MVIKRKLQSEIDNLLKQGRSILLLGPRQVGKSTLIHSLSPELVINLADESEYFRFAANPDALRNVISESRSKTIFIDEVQRLPRILNTVQALIDADKSLKFYLTGSSARKLRKSDSNLLPGRVFNFKLGPIIAAEMNYQMDTIKALQWGTLPEVVAANDQKNSERLLKSYAANYLKEEIKAESLVRNLDSFSRFFHKSLECVGEFVDYSKFAKLTKISRHAIPRYFEILEDTLVGYRLLPWSDSYELDLVKHPKFYYFDCGVYNGMLGNFIASADRKGKLAEQLVFSQLIHSAWAREKDIQISTFRTRKGVEVDFVIELEGKIFGIEVKSSFSQSDDLTGLETLQKTVGKKFGGGFIFHMDSGELKRKNYSVVPWQKGLRALGL